MQPRHFPNYSAIPLRLRFQCDGVSRWMMAKSFFRNVLTNPDILAPQNSPKYIQQIPKAGNQKIFLR